MPGWEDTALTRLLLSRSGLCMSSLVHLPSQSGRGHSKEQKIIRSRARGPAVGQRDTAV